MGQHDVLTILVFVILHNPWLASAEIFSSVDQLEDLSSVETTLYKTLEKYIDQENVRLKELRRLYTQEKVLLAERTATGGVGNPSNAFAMINRANEDRENVIKPILKSRVKHRTELIQDFRRHKSHFPTSADFNGTRAAMVRLQEVYDISPQSISDGILPGHHRAHAQLAAFDSYQIGRKAYEDGSAKVAKSWFENTLRMMGTQDSLRDFTGEVRVRRTEVLNHMAFLEYQLNNWSRSLDYYREITEQDPSDTLNQYNIDQMEQLIALNHNNSDVLRNESSSAPSDEVEENMITYSQLCRHGNKRSTSQHKQHRLTCTYVNKHPGLRLRPVAMETLNLSPRITMFHNVLSEVEIKEMLRLARPQLKRARVNEGERVEIAKYRISKIAWLREVDSDLIRRVNRRVSILTGLNTESGEYLQVNNYGIGGHYEPHFDHSLDMKTSPMAVYGKGNRIATFMFYLSEVEAGGSTVFVKTGVKATPSKGGAIFWYNLKKSGEGDTDSLHAGCPVLLGNKWVANKWLHEHGNEFNRRCGLTQDE